MKEKWKYIDERDGDFQEAFLLSDEGNKIKVEVNRYKKQVKIYAETDSGKVIESSITNGVVLEETNLETGAKENLREDFKKLELYLSAIPDSKVIRLIGGNYGVFGEFIQTMTNYANEDVMLLKLIGMSIVMLPVKIITGLLGWFRDIAQRPRISDIVDSMLVLSCGYLTYLVNFDFALGGFVLMVGAVTSGYIDWLIRHREPYILKVIVIFIPAFYIVTVGLRYQ